MWGGALALCFPSGVQSEDDTYKKSIAIQLHLFAWELPDTVLVRPFAPPGNPVHGFLRRAWSCPWLGSTQGARASRSVVETRGRRGGVLVWSSEPPGTVPGPHVFCVGSKKLRLGGVARSGSWCLAWMSRTEVRRRHRGRVRDGVMGHQRFRPALFRISTSNKLEAPAQGNSMGA